MACEFTSRNTVDNSRWFVLPSESLRDLVLRRMRSRYPHFNRALTWKDTRGWVVRPRTLTPGDYGLALSNCSWVEPGRFLTS